MNDLLNQIDSLKSSNVKKIIDNRIQEFKNIGQKPNEELFKELCFCLMTANFNAARSIDIQKALDDEFLTLPEEELADKLKFFGHRFPKVRAKYLTGARKHVNDLTEVMEFFKNDENELREWVVEHVKGLGFKEASHFLRNIGYDNFAIIDFHIIDLLERNKLIEKPKTMTKNKYFEIENLLKKIADKSGLTLAELDLYLWYKETGKILK